MQRDSNVQCLHACMYDWLNACVCARQASAKTKCNQKRSRKNAPKLQKCALANLSGALYTYVYLCMYVCMYVRSCG